MRKIPASIRLIFPSSPSRMKSIVTRIRNGISFLTVELPTPIGMIAAAVPRIRNIFRILLPRTLPIEISALPEIAPVILTAASGALVPIATIVRPMISSEIPNFLAKPEAPSTKKSAPFIRNINPTISSAVFLASSIASSSFPVALKAFGSAPAGLRPCRMPVSNSCISGLSYRCPMPSCTRTFHFPRIQTVTAAAPVII